MTTFKSFTQFLSEKDGQTSVAKEVEKQEEKDLVKRAAKAQAAEVEDSEIDAEEVIDADDAADESQVDEEAEGAMYKVKIKDIISNATKILDMLGNDEDLEAWIQDKITIADHNMDAICGYYGSEKKEKEPEEVTPDSDLQKGDHLINSGE